MRLRRNPDPIKRWKAKLIRRRLAVLASVAFALSLLSAPPLLAQAPTPPTDLQVKAAYLYKFGAFVTWPNAVPTGSFDICILGHDPFGQTLDSTIAGESINGAKLSARRIVSPQEATRCRILFISSSEEGRLREILSAVSNLPVLTVSDMPRFVDRGGGIQFVLENGRVRFDVNVTSAQKAGLALSSQLLKVASAVKRGEGRD
jgi:uncharacterized protein DUF4154